MRIEENKKYIWDNGLMQYIEVSKGQYRTWLQNEKKKARNNFELREIKREIEALGA